MSESRARRLHERLRDPILFGSAVTLLIYLAHSWTYLFLNDDAYISFRYALHWIDHGEPVYNLGERVEGYTNFLWVALLSLAYSLGAPIPKASLYLSVVLGLASMILVSRYAVRMKEGQREEVVSFSRYRSLLTIFLLSLSPSYACWTSGGLEVMLFGFTLSLGLILSVRSWTAASRTKTLTRERLLGVSAGSTLALAAMTRPEGVMIFGLVGLYRVISLLRQRSWLRAGDWGAIIAYSLIYFPYFAWRYDYYGYLFPNTYYAKVGASGFWGPGLRYVGEWFLFHPWLFAPLAWLGLSLRRERPAAKLSITQINEEEETLARLMLLCTSAMILHIARVGGDFMALHRFLVPLLPLCALLCSRPLLELLLSLTRLKQRALGLSMILLLSLGAVTIHQDANRIGSRDGVDSIGWLRQFSEQCATTGRYINRVSPKDAKLATTAAGALPFYAERYTLDLLGLNDEWIAHHVPARGHRPGHTKAAPFRYPIDKKIDYLIYHPSFTRAKPSASERMSRALRPHNYKWESHRVPGLQPPWWSVWTRVSHKSLKSTKEH
jgi:hypothetical protein